MGFSIGKGAGKGRGRPARGSRERVLRAARKVFARHPYEAATLRMVAAAGGFDHQLISYYFPSKAELFEAIVADSCRQFEEANRGWFEGLERLGPDEAFALYVERLLDHHFANPEPLRIVALNAHLSERFEEVPGYRHIPELLARTRSTFVERTGLTDSEDLNRFLHTFNAVIVSYLGAAPAQAAILGMDPNGAEYRTWVKETLLCVFLPLLKRMLRGGRAGRTHA